MLTPAESGWQSFWRRFSQRRSLPLLLLLSLSLLLLDRSGAAFFQQLKLRLADATAPVLEAGAFTQRLSNALQNTVESHFALSARNARLREENARLHQWRARALNMQHRLSRYEDLLQVTLPPQSSFLTARVLGKAAGPFERAVILQAGGDQGIQYGQGVMDANGLVGRIIGIGKTTSRVLLLSDFNSRVPVLVESEGDLPPKRGIASGDGSDILRLEYLPEDTGVSQGERVVTSGDGGFLPAGLLVGEIVAFDDEQPLVAPAMESDRLEWVLVFTQAATHDVPDGSSAAELFSEGGVEKGEVGEGDEAGENSENREAGAGSEASEGTENGEGETGGERNTGAEVAASTEGESEAGGAGAEDAAGAESEAVAEVEGTGAAGAADRANRAGAENRAGTAGESIAEAPTTNATADAPLAAPGATLEAAGSASEGGVLR